MAKVMRSTVIVDHPDGARVRLTKGSEAPDWYEGSATVERDDDTGKVEDVRSRQFANFHGEPLPVPEQGPRPGEGKQPADYVDADEAKRQPGHGDDDKGAQGAATDGLTEAEATLLGSLPTEDQEALAALSDDERAALAELAGDGAQEGDDEQPPTPDFTDDELTDGSVSDVLDRVGDNRELASRALAVEQAADKPRATLVASLTTLVKALDEPGA